MKPRDPSVNRKRIKGTAAGVVTSSFAEVSALLLEVQSGKVSGQQLPLVLAGSLPSLEINGGPRHFTVMTGAGSAAIRLCFLEVDQINHSIAIHGGWWFRGEYTVTPHAQGSLVTYNLYNAASGLSGAIAGLLHRRELQDARPTLEQLLQRLGERLGCEVHVCEERVLHTNKAGV